MGKAGKGGLIAAAIAVAALVGIKLPPDVAAMIEQVVGAPLPAAIVQDDKGAAESRSTAAGQMVEPRVGSRNPADAPAQPPTSSGIADDFRQAKRWMYEIYADHRIDAYCGCPFDQSRRNIDTAACGYRIKEDRTRGSRIEAEHVIPASWLGKPRACWEQRGCFDAADRRVEGRNCCLATDAEFRQAHNDLNNLLPTIGELNKHRGSYPLGEVRGEPRDYGQCDFEVRSRGPVEPPPEIRGDIARIGFYMKDRYNADIRQRQMQTFRQWDKDDPVDDWERERNRRIAAKQGIGNRYVQ